MSILRQRAFAQPRAHIYALDLLEALDTPVSLSVALLLKYREFDQVARKSINPRDYCSSESFFADAQAVKLLSKYENLPTTIDTRAVGEQKFRESEAKCKETNARFRHRADSGNLFPLNVERVLNHAYEKIQSVLGDVPSLESLDFRFGPGAAYGVRGETSYFNKLVSKLECTYAMARILPEFLEEFPGWIPEGTHTVTLVEGSELTYVPKDAKTDRPICIEPLLNGLYQKGVGTYLRGRLRKFRINLDDQTINQKLAKASVRRHLATVDFSSASDTLSYGLVMDLLPVDWFEFLDVARCPNYKSGGIWEQFQKFSSMGNAYTFELESLLFYALAWGTMKECGITPTPGFNLGVYGDDVILPQSCVDLYQEVSELCGFNFNTEKSFREGLFFESCGKDYFNGDNVRPFQVKTTLRGILPVCLAVNDLRRIAQRYEETSQSPYGSGPQEKASRHKRLVDLWYRWFNQYRNLGCSTGPEGFGDGHLVCPFDVAVPPRHRQWDAYVFHTIAQVAVVVEKEAWPIFYATYSLSAPGLGVSLFPDEATTQASKGYAVRNRTRLKRLRVATMYWYNSVEDAENIRIEHRQRSPLRRGR